MELLWSHLDIKGIQLNLLVSNKRLIYGNYQLARGAFSTDAYVHRHHDGTFEDNTKQVRESQRRLGSALANPIDSTSALRRVGVVFTWRQKLLIRFFVVIGQIAKAQRTILKYIRREFE